MQRTTAPNSSGGLHVDKIPGSVVGTTGIALDRNNLQEEIVNTILGEGLALGVAQTQLHQAIASMAYPLGRRIESFIELTPGTFCPVVRIDDADHDIDTTHYAALVTALRAIKLKVNATTDFSCTVAGSVATLASTTAGDRFLAALAEDLLADNQFGKTLYTTWLCVNINGTDYAITNVNAGARTITVTGTPTSGAQTLICYRYRIAGSSTSARLLRDSGRAFVGTQAETGDASDRWSVAGLRMRDRGQGHRHNPTAGNNFISSAAGAVYGGTGSGTTVSTTGDPVTDGTNGTPRVGPTTDPRTVSGFIYLGAGIYN